MIAEGTLVYVDNKRYQLGKRIGDGTEGYIYQLDNLYVAKIYKNPNTINHEKIKLLIGKSISKKGLCLPTKLIKDINQNIIGFSLPYAKGREIRSFLAIAQRLPPNWSRIDLLDLALQICDLYHTLHSNGILAGDIHSQNMMLDEKDNLYATYFHANCGGQTCQPDYVWNETLPGFDSFKDTFCIRTRQATWEKKIPVNEWKAFMVNKYDFPIWDSLSNFQLYNFQQLERHAFFIHPFYGIPLRDLREAFQLKSTFFSCSQEGEYVVLKGRGFGHGVGLCQEGAMNMSKKGFDYQQILLFYYPKMRLTVQSDRLNRKM
jgi:serine/threonine protein kinase